MEDQEVIAVESHHIPVNNGKFTIPKQILDYFTKYPESIGI